MEWGLGDEAGQNRQASALQVQPLDEHNAQLLAKVHPLTHTNPTPCPMYNMIVIGAGAGGLVTAAQSAKRGARVALIEACLMGGDCLNTGCVPSKALLACAKHIKYVREGVTSTFGIRIRGGDASVEVDFDTIMARMRRLRADIASNDSVQRFKGLGIDVFIGRGKFLSEHSVQVETTDTAHTSGVCSEVLNFRKACIATGGQAYIPPIPGLSNVLYHTNETIFNLTSLPTRLAIIGAGPIGCELAQAFAYFGSKVTVFNKSAQPLSKEDPDAAELLLAQLRKDGVTFITGVSFEEVSPVDVEEGAGGGGGGEAGGQGEQAMKIRITNASGEQESYVCDVLLIATGRAPRIHGLGFEAAHVKFDAKGVKVDDFLRTSNPDVYAVGDVCLKHQFTHMAGETGLMVAHNALNIGPPQKLSERVVPWCTYTFPEVAHVGKYKRDCDEDDLRTFTLKLEHFDRLMTDDYHGAAGARQGFVRIHVRAKSDEILGATIVAQNAGELISFFTLAIHAGIGAKAVSGVIAPYPTVAEVMKFTANQVNINDWGGWDGLKAKWQDHVTRQLQ